MRRIRRIAELVACAVISVGVVQAALVEKKDVHYYWKSDPAGDNAQILTLFCNGCQDSAGKGLDVPLVAVLRDTLGDNTSKNDRVTYVWLLTYSRPNVGKRILSAVPFFYWRVGGGTAAPKREDKPLLNLTAPRHSVVASAVHNVVQWTVLDPAIMPVRATSRAYQTNRTDHERLHLEEAESYLRSAPVSEDEGALTEKQLNTVIARLELRKRMLGGFVSERRAAELGEEANFEQERVRARNWELLRQCADKTGLLFDPVELAGTKNEYAVLWYPLEQTAPPTGVALGPVWKLLNLSDPYTQQEKLRAGEAYERTVDGQTGSYMPLGVYSLNYPKQPLLVVDFRDGQHLRRHELTQRAINEVTAGVIGISHFTNWYYYAGAGLYNFYVSRHGAAVNRGERLDSYSQFRVALALDHNLDTRLRKDMQRRVDTLAVNPLESAPQQELRAATQRYQNLVSAGENGRLERKLDKERRVELAEFGAGQGERVRDDIFHYVTLGIYTHRVKDSEDLLARLDAKRRVEYNLALLDRLTAAGTEPEVALGDDLIRKTVTELRGLLPEIEHREVREHAEKTLEKLATLSRDATLKAECALTVDSLRGVNEGTVAEGGLSDAEDGATLK